MAIEDWFGFNDDTNAPFDIQPGVWRCINPARKADTYIGMVTREVGTYKSIAQSLSKPLEKDKFYAFSVWLAQSEKYFSRTSISHTYDVNFDVPATLVISILQITDCQ